MFEYVCCRNGIEKGFYGFKDVFVEKMCIILSFKYLLNCNGKVKLIFWWY